MHVQQATTVLFGNDVIVMQLDGRSRWHHAGVLMEDLDRSLQNHLTIVRRKPERPIVVGEVVTSLLAVGFEPWRRRPSIGRRSDAPMMIADRTAEAA
jgi:hypothetical protein